MAHSKPEDHHHLMTNAHLSGEKKRKKSGTDSSVPRKSKKAATVPSSSSPASRSPERLNGFLQPFSWNELSFRDCFFVHNQSPANHGIARVAYGAFSGKWFFEVEVLAPTQPTEAAGVVSPPLSVSIGCTTGQGDLNCELGSNEYGYGYSSEGRLLHGKNSSTTGLSVASFSHGDVIGCLIDFGSFDISPSGESASAFTESSIVFYKNGVPLDGKFENLLKGTYYAAVSVAGGGVRMNPGPNFRFPPADQSMPISQLVPVHLRNSGEEQHKPRPRVKRCIEGETSQYNQCCHHCRAKPRPGLGVLHCSYNTCTRIFCLRCIRKYYSSHGTESELCALSKSSKWVCLCCQNSCICKACQRVRFRKEEATTVGKVKSSKKSPQLSAGELPVSWGAPNPADDVPLTDYDMEAALGLAALFSLRNSSSPQMKGQSFKQVV
mmetsp:Transcript_20609/g.28454  ORF Transcript_20609/g.28454 Transcript_20609/m.28454 type:complete len:436 (-) Transcript_20609:108-1415(-)